MYKSNTSKKEDLLFRLKSELAEARKDLENGSNEEKIENIFFLEDAINNLEYDILNSSNY